MEVKFPQAVRKNTDIPHKAEMSSSGWNDLYFDKTYYGALINVKVAGANYNFKKEIGGYFNSLTQLTRLLGAYKNDFEDETPIKKKKIAFYIIIWYNRAEGKKYRSNKYE